MRIFSKKYAQDGRGIRQFTIQSGVVAALLLAPTLSLANQVTFSCTGFPQYFVVPTGVANLSVTVYRRRRHRCGWLWRRRRHRKRQYSCDDAPSPKDSSGLSTI